MIYVTKACYKGQYIIELEFSDGLSGSVNLRDTIFNDHREIFQELKNDAKFKEFTVDHDTIVWSNGLDLAPEYLYSKLTRSDIGH